MFPHLQFFRFLGHLLTILLTITIIVHVADFSEIEHEAVKIYSRPVIGIPTMAITDQVQMKVLPEMINKSYIAASYVKYLEMAGARVVAIPPNIGAEKERKIFESVNGILFPGGEVNLEDSEYYFLTKRLFKWAVEANEKSNFFPLMGICRGMQAIIVHSVGDISPLIETDARNYTTTLQFYNEFQGSKLLTDLSDSIKRSVETENLTSHFHKYGVTPQTFHKIKAINRRFKIIATSKDRKGIEFVSHYEGK